ncbi:uncharacterized protein L203_104981 [Cryptococcus depauperatus CBS 7841]|uniref:Uncharacterized protein n=1 Tax=Cryptococcus depauperatus CBS 7841 TaxID=1295531 RepID=A0A1E3I1A3_9TREE|nr:hypothetical protein L203_05443 [Cryptococcus depauperatus CBS 7841]
MSDFHHALSGAQRVNSSPRLHRYTSPYKRPQSMALRSSSTMGDLASYTKEEGLPLKSLATPVTKTRTQKLVNSTGPLSKSRNESSLFSGIKSIISKPLQWLATPGNDSAKRDSVSSFGQDLEDPESPSDRREGKRIRRISPRHKENSIKGDYDPEHKYDIGGHAINDFMLPPHVNLKPKSRQGNRPASYSSSTLPSSHSMSYLDPPPNALRSGVAATLKSTSSPRRGGMLTRSKRMDLASLAVDDDDISVCESDIEHKEKDSDNLSPWRSRYGSTSAAASRAVAPRNRIANRPRSAIIEERDFAIPSASPFRVTASSKSTGQASAIGLARSSTLNNFRRPTSLVSDISLTTVPRSLARSTSVKNWRELDPEVSSVYGGSVKDGNDDDRYSADGETVRRREGSVLDWFAQDKWDKPGSSASLAASRRLGSATPSASSTIRKGQMIWNPTEKVFMRESELKASQQPALVHKNEAERILYTLEAMRKSSPGDAHKDSLPPLLGQSSRTLRRNINVPLATAAAGESARQRRDKERLGERGVSVMISPYGRRRIADKEARDVHRRSQTQEGEYQPSPSPSDVKSEPSQMDPQPEVAAGKGFSVSPVSTPRRSSRLKHQSTERETTPKPTRRSTRRGTSKEPDIHNEAPIRSSRRTRKTTTERALSPSPPPATSAPPMPIITETAPSPNGSSGTSNYQPRPSNELSRGGSSLRAKSNTTKRTHQSAAIYSRSQTPTSSGRYSARDEDLPDMDDLEQNKIALPSFSGISFDGIKPVANDPKPPANPAAPLPPLSLPRAGGPLARLGVASTRPRASSPLATGSIIAIPESPPTLSTQKNAEPVQPLAGGIFPIGSGAGVSAKSGSLFPGIGGSGSTTPEKTSVASPFFSKPSSPVETPATFTDKPLFSFDKSSGINTNEITNDKPAGIPNFFGHVTAPPMEKSSFAPSSGFDLGAKKSEKSEKTISTSSPAIATPSAPPFSFSKPTDKEDINSNGGTSPFLFRDSALGEKNNSAAAPLFKFSDKDGSAGTSSFGFGEKVTPAPIATISSGDEKRDTASIRTDASAFKFGGDKKESIPTVDGFKIGEKKESMYSTTSSPFSFSAPQVVEAPKSAFSSSTSSPSTSVAHKPTVEGPSKPSSVFGQLDANASKPAEPASKPAFSFSTPSTSTPVSKPAFNFGASSNTFVGTPSPIFGTPKDANANKSTTPAAPPPAFGGFNFGKPAKEPEEKKDQSTHPFSNALASKSDFTFDQPSSTTSTTNKSTGSPFGAPATNGDASKPFGNIITSGSSTPSFAFGASKTTAPVPDANASKSASFMFGAAGNSGSTTTSNPFGATPAAQTTTSSPSFPFGANSATPTSNTLGSNSAASSSNPFGQQADQKVKQPVPTTPTFNFGASQAPPTATTPSFSFGQPTASTPANPNFSFGTPTQPTSAPFGQPSAQSGGFSFGAGNETARFKSPTPVPEGGGFSLGIAGNNTGPGSPGGRRVKGLPRRR